MNYKIKSIVVALAATLSLSACDSMRKEDVGTVTGGLLGAAVGSQIGGGSGRTAAVIGGTIIGAYLGGRVGESMDELDRLKMSQALENNKTNESRTWTNPDSHAKYTVTPTRTYYRRAENSQTQPCREYTTTAIIGGKKEEIYGTACRMADGSWKIVNS